MQVNDDAFGHTPAKRKQSGSSGWTVRAGGSGGDGESATWLALNRVPFAAGCRQAVAAFIECEGPSAMLAAGAATRRALGLNEAAAAALDSPLGRAAAADLEWLSASAGWRAVHFGSADFPPLLRAIADPPFALFVCGDAGALAGPLVAIVGARRATPGGRRTAQDLARGLASAGVGVVSGLAVGIDGAAHRGVLEGGGLTVAVMGTGPQTVYPRVHERLALDVAAGGALVTEFPPGAPGAAANFPRRNRLVSGLSLGVVVVEAARRSGSLITARLAAEQGREVFAVPGSIHSPLSAGCHALIRDGATLTAHADDVLREIAPALGAGLAAAAACRTGAGVAGRGSALAARAEHSLTPELLAVLEALDYVFEPFDTVVARCELPPGDVSSALLALELDGLADSAPGGRYCRSGGGAAAMPGAAR